MKNNRKFSWGIAVLCTALPDIGAGTATPAIALVAKAMPQVDIKLVQMIVSIPSICLIFFPPIYARLTGILKKKTLLWIAFLCMLIGAIGPALSNSIYPILFFRFVLGLSGGIIMPVTVDLILDIFEGKEKQSMLGYAAAVTSLGGIVFQTLGGIAGAVNWRYCFLATCVTIPFYLFALIFLPDLPVAKATEEDKKGNWISHMKPSLWCLSGFMILWEMMYFVFLTNISLYLVNEGIATTAQVGVITSVVTVGGMLVSAFYGKFISFLQEKAFPTAYLVTATGFLIITVVHTPVLVGLGALGIGIGYGMGAPLQLNMASSMVSKKYESAATSLCYTSRGIGGFVSPFVIAAICSALGIKGNLFPFQLAAGVLIILSVLAVIYVKVMHIKIDNS